MSGPASPQQQLTRQVRARLRGHGGHTLLWPRRRPAGRRPRQRHGERQQKGHQGVHHLRQPDQHVPRPGGRRPRPKEVHAVRTRQRPLPRL